MIYSLQNTFAQNYWCNAQSNKLMFLKKLITSIVFSLLFSFQSCTNEKKVQSYYEVIKSCEPVIVNDTIRSNFDCLDGAPIPEFSIIDINGNTISNETMKGKLTLLNFWFIECPPCIEEMPSLSRINDIFRGKNFNIISICRNSRTELDEFLKDHSFPYRVAADGRTVLEEIFKNPFGYPSNVLVDEIGKIINVYHALIEENKNTEYEVFINEVRKNL